MDTHKLKDTYIKEMMSIIDDEKLMQETLNALRSFKEKRAVSVPCQFTAEEVKKILAQNLEDIKNGNAVPQEQAELLMDKFLQEV